MIVVAKEDVLKGLKKFKRLAKQDLLVSQLTSEPVFWTKQAEGRRKTYDRLMEIIDDQGVDHAYKSALKLYAELPFVFTDEIEKAEIIGTSQALEMFFTMIGVQPPAKDNIKIPPANYRIETEDIALKYHS
ncbi:MAG: hypothetical protein GX994_02400 [Firmicutes bacterium]|nr:hypothetical protein [Bacillota bacterium]